MSLLGSRLEEEIVPKWPLIFQGKWWGGIGDGWCDLIDELCSELYPLIEDFIAKNPDCESPRLAQVKEKFGTLRWYMDFGTPEMWDIVDKYEKESAKVCESCGQPGTTSTSGWRKTLCERCRLQ